MILFDSLDFDLNRRTLASPFHPIAVQIDHAKLENGLIRFDLPNSHDDLRRLPSSDAPSGHRFLKTAAISVCFGLF